MDSKPPKLENFGLKICPQGFRGAADLGFRGTAPGVSRHSTRGFEGQQHGVSRGSNMGPGGTATLIEHLSDLSFPAVPRGPI